ncbi:hypothetical protein Tco_1489899 [Tanacetum coccineum]
MQVPGPSFQLWRCISKRAAQKDPIGFVESVEGLGVIMETHGGKKAIGEPAPPARDPRDVEMIERLQQRIQELELQQLRPDSPAEEAEIEPNV